MSYFSNVLRHPAATIDTICHAINNPKFGRIDLIVGTGMSGTLVLLPVSIKSKIPFGAIRKEIDTRNCFRDGGSHSVIRVETFLLECHLVYRYVILDDFVATGGTIRRIRHIMTKEYKHSQCVGVILYQGSICSRVDSLVGVPVSYLDEDIQEVNALRKIQPKIIP